MSGGPYGIDESAQPISLRGRSACPTGPLTALKNNYSVPGWQL